MKLRTHTKVIRVAIASSILAVIVIATTMLACNGADNEQARHVLEDHGFSKVIVNESGVGFAAWHGCGESDGAWYETTADNPTGKRVNMTVCCGAGWSLKSCTVRSK